MMTFHASIYSHKEIIAKVRRCLNKPFVLYLKSTIVRNDFLHSCLLHEEGINCDFIAAMICDLNQLLFQCHAEISLLD